MAGKNSNTQLTEILITGSLISYGPIIFHLPWRADKNRDDVTVKKGAKIQIQKYLDNWVEPAFIT